MTNSASISHSQHFTGSRGLLSAMVLSVVGQLLSASPALGQLTADLTCSPTGGNLHLVNNGSTTITVTMITAAFRGFPDPATVNRNPEDTTPRCADTSYWELRSPTVIAPDETVGNLIVVESSGGFDDIDLFKILPENFPATSLRPANLCQHFIVSMQVEYDAGTGIPPQPLVVSCKVNVLDPQQPFPEPTTAPTVSQIKQMQIDLVMAQGISPAAAIAPDPPKATCNSQGSNGDCFDRNEFSAMLLQNRSTDTTYQGIYAGRFKCQTTVGGTCRTNPDPNNPESPQWKRGMRGSARGFRIGPEADCVARRINPAGGPFPKCCDCTPSGCPAPNVYQCARTVVTGWIPPRGLGLYTL